MNQFKVYISFLLLLPTNFLSGQAIDNLSCSRNINGDRYFRLHYENDFFTATDYYYSQGINLEFVHPSIKKISFAKILLHPGNTNLKYGVCVEQDCYTPTSIRHTDIIFGDRPFAACLFLKTFLISVDSSRQFRFASALDVGIIGPSAGGEWMQKTIHRSLKNIEPLGLGTPGSK